VRGGYKGVARLDNALVRARTWCSKRHVWRHRGSSVLFSPAFEGLVWALVVMGATTSALPHQAPADPRAARRRLLRRPALSRGGRQYIRRSPNAAGLPPRVDLTIRLHLDTRLNAPVGRRVGPKGGRPRVRSVRLLWPPKLLKNGH
jgi:hypothetical protein